MLSAAFAVAVPGVADAQARSTATIPTPRFDSLAFKGSVVDNPLFPLRPGAAYVFEITDDGETSVDSVTVLRETKRVAGVTATVVHDRVSRRGAIVEDTFDWYAQDTSGTVWYLGEDTKEYRAGKVVSTAGSWQAGVAGAIAGIMMKAHPRVGDSYRQEYRRGVAEDMGRVVSVTDSAAVRAGRFTSCVTTEDWSPLEPKVRERKTYCPGVGLVRERVTTGGSERSELVAIVRP
jgi:hypothetical protein